MMRWKGTSVPGRLKGILVESGCYTPRCILQSAYVHLPAVQTRYLEQTQRITRREQSFGEQGVSASTGSHLRDSEPEHAGACLFSVRLVAFHCLATAHSTKSDSVQDTRGIGRVARSWEGS